MDSNKNFVEEGLSRLVRLFVCYMRPGEVTLDTSLKGLTINVNGRHEC